MCFLLFECAAGHYVEWLAAIGMGSKVIQYSFNIASTCPRSGMERIAPFFVVTR